MNYPYQNGWGPPWGMQQQPVVFIPSPASGPNTNPPPSFNSWQEVQKHAKMMAKKELKLKAKWEAEAKKKDEEKKRKEEEQPNPKLVGGGGGADDAELRKFENMSMADLEKIGREKGWVR